MMRARVSSGFVLICAVIRGSGLAVISDENYNSSAIVVKSRQKRPRGGCQNAAPWCKHAQAPGRARCVRKESRMFIAMNRFRVKKGSEEAFEKVWLSRDTHLAKVPGFVEFHLLKGPEHEDFTLYAS